MGSKLIGTTDRSGLSLAQVGGNDVYKMLHQLQSVIESGNLGPEYVKLFSEPVENGRSIDWYVESGEKVVPLAQLDDASRKALLSRFGEMVGRLQEYAGDLRKNSSEAYRNYAAILEKALIVPDMEQALYSADGEPVLVNWGFSTGDNEIVDGAQSLMKDIQDKLEKIRDIQDKVEKATESSPLAPASEKVEEIANEAPADGPEASRNSASAEEAPLTPEPEANAGQPAQPPQPAAPASGAGSNGWLYGTIVGAVLLAAGAAAMWYFLKHEPATQREEGQPSMAWLKGEVNAKGVLIDENDDAVDLTLRFEGEDGRGQSFISSKDQTCTGTVVAQQQPDNRVSFAVSELECPNKHNYEPFTLNCIRGQNICTGTNRNGESWELKVDF